MARTRNAEPTPQSAAEEQAAQDAALLTALQERDGDQPPTDTPAPRRNQTIGENFVSVVELIRTARQQSRLSEATLVKIYELNLMWALNNRQTVDQNIFPGDAESMGTEGDGAEAPDLPEPNERITGDEESTNGS